MAWKGKFIGALVGLLITRTVWGAVIGALIGQLFDQGLAPRAAAPPSVAQVFFRSTFEMMGHVAKSDGRVSEAEIEAARRLMRELRLSPDETTHAIDCFRTGKIPVYDPESSVERLREACGQRHDLLRNFIELQLRAALTVEGMSPQARAILSRVAERLGMSGLEFARMEASLQAQRQNPGAGDSGANQSARGTSSARKSLADCYAELEVDAGVSDQDLTRAYRRQMSRHHPDKLVANGLPESMAQIAKEKTQRIQEAYEGIRAARGML
jgi:DnaJ like chaperone protein